MRFLISEAREKKAFSTLMFDFAETSMKGMPSSSARAWPWAVLTTRFSSQSHLFPIRILLTPSLACCSTFENQVGMSAKTRRLARGKRGRGKSHGVKRTIEALLVRHVVDKQNTHGSTVVGGGDGAEALLACGIPDLQLDALAVELDGADLEVNADGGDERGGEAVLAES